MDEREAMKLQNELWQHEDSDPGDRPPVRLVPAGAHNPVPAGAHNPVPAGAPQSPLLPESIFRAKPAGAKPKAKPA
eukprot:5258876-Amphidinium_carterae.1